MNTVSILCVSGLFFVACGSNNACPSGETMLNGVCSVSSSSTASNCSSGEVLTAQGCLEQNLQMCAATSGWNGVNCVPGSNFTTANGQSTDASQYWQEYHQCGNYMIQGYQTCTCIGGLVYSLQYNQCVYPTPTNTTGVGYSSTGQYCYNGYYYVNGQTVCR